MFRTTCDKRVTTSAARQPTNSKPAHLEMPAGKPDVHQTRPLQSWPGPTTARQRRIATHHDPPSIGIPTPAAPAVCCALSQLATLEPAALNISRASAAWPTPITAPDPDLSKVTTRTAEYQTPPPTTPMPADDADDHRRPGSPNID